MSFTSKSDVILNVRACRICLDSKCINVVTLNDQNGWLQLFQYCFGLPLTTPDVPRILCESCADNVRNYSKFKKLCEKSDKLWRSLTKVKCCAQKIEDHNIIKDEVQNRNDCDSENNDNEPFDNKLKNIREFNNAHIKSEPSKDEIFKEVKSEITNKDKLLSDKKHEKERSSLSVTTKVKDIFTCKICLKNYARKSWFLTHSKLCTSKKHKQRPTSGDPEYSSGTGIKSREVLKIPKFDESTNNRQNFLHFCGICNFSSTCIEDVNKHLDQHWISNDLQCMMCEFIGKDQAAIAAHRYTHYAVKATNYLCHICQKKTKSQLTLQFHYRKVHLNQIGGLCSQPQCDKVYNSWRLWKTHEKLHHHPGYICDICGQKYKHKHLIAEHLTNHTNPPAHVCDVCGKTFLRMSNLKIHIENVHVQADPIKCSHCDRMFKNQFYLKVHQRRLAMEKIWKCEFCSMEYPMLSALNSHMKSHSDERPHCCHVCGSRYKAKSQLAVHMRNHTGDRPYKCVMCTKAFTSGTQLKAHTMTHTRALPHKCLHCEKTFRSKKRMLNHCAVRHKTPDKTN